MRKILKNTIRAEIIKSGNGHKLGRKTHIAAEAMKRAPAAIQRRFIRASLPERN